MELVQWRDRSVKTKLNIKLIGHVVPNAEYTLPQGNANFFNKASVLFGLESVVDINNLPK